MPIWLGWGRHDSVFILDTGFNAARALEVSPLHVFERSGHMPQIEEQHAFERELSNFIVTLDD